MSKIAVLTDSTADMSPEVAKELGVEIIPLNVTFGEETFFDTDFKDNEFYDRLMKCGKQLPKTSQPSPEAFRKTYERLLMNYQEVVSIHLSSGLSGTINAARLAAEQWKERIHIVDSKAISLGINLMVQEAVKNIRDGFTSQQVVDSLDKVRKNIETMFTVNTLEYLQKGGRIGKVQGVVGSILNIKPLIRVGDDGIYHTFSQVRSQGRAFKAMLDGFKELSAGRKVVQMGIAHGAALPQALDLKAAFENVFQIKTEILTQVGSAIGVHTGPGVVGAAIQFEG